MSQEPNLSPIQKITAAANRLADRVIALWHKANEAFEKSTWPKKVSAKAAAISQKYQIRERLARLIPADVRKDLPKSFDPIALSEWFTELLKKGGIGAYARAVAVLLGTFFVADLTALWLESFIPDPPPVRAVKSSNSYHAGKSLDQYNIILSRNLFNSEGKIPGEGTGPIDLPTTPLADPNAAPVKTSLPFNLIGTLILRDPNRSIGTIEDKGAATVYPVRIEDEIPGKARILYVEPMRVVFLNLANNIKEYVELPQQPGTATKISVTSTAPKATGVGIEQLAPNHFNIARNEIENALKDLNQILTQARAIPHFENGQPAGYKLFQIVPGSIYDKLGLKNGDLLCGINGDPINDPGKAFGMLGELKTASHLELCVKRDGKVNNHAYDIR